MQYLSLFCHQIKSYILLYGFLFSWKKSDFSKGVSGINLIHKEAPPNYQPLFQQVESDKYEDLQKGKQVNQAGMFFIPKWYLPPNSRNGNFYCTIHSYMNEFRYFKPLHNHHQSENMCVFL